MVSDVVKSVSLRETKIINLNEDFEASVKRLDELKANRHVDDIPISDEYWRALVKHQIAHNRSK